MSSRCSSAPRMQRVWTPRVRDGRRSNEDAKAHYYGKTAGSFKFDPNPSYLANPESPAQNKQAKKFQQEVQNAIQQKISVEVRQDEVRRKGKVTMSPQANRGKKNNQQTHQGRKLEFPAEQRGYGGGIGRPNIARSGSMELRASSATSRHFVDRSVRSSQIKAQKAEFDDKFKVAFGYLLDQNQAYLKETRRACNQKARPREEMFKVKRPTISTTNQNEYTQKNAPYEQEMEAQNLKTANSFGPRKVCGNSTNNEAHCGRQGKKADLQHWPEGFKLQGQLYGVTRYANDYPDHGNYEKMAPVATFNEHPRGFPHKTNSTHRTFYKGGQAEAAKLATWNNMHPYGNDFNPDRGTHTADKHGPKQQQSIQQWPMYEPQLIKSQTKFLTEYGTKLQDSHNHELNEANYCGCERKRNRH